MPQPDIRTYRPVFVSLDATIERFRKLTAVRFVWCIVSMSRKSERRNAWTSATSLVRQLCVLAGSPTIIDDCARTLAKHGISRAIENHDDQVLFGWLMEGLSYQGVSDAVAEAYMNAHGYIDHADIADSLIDAAGCSKLRSYWQFDGCGYRKWAKTCNNRSYYRSCPLPRHDLRNGRLNQTAYSLYLFMRDVAGGDFVSWLDSRLTEASASSKSATPDVLSRSVTVPLSHVHGASHKVVCMTLSALLLGGAPDRELWKAAGGAMIAIDTLVHNWLHRSGILKSLGAGHLYGPKCYAANGCAAIIKRVSGRIDARTFNPDFPRVFPRFVQHAIWQFCSQSGVAQCNGNTIDDSRRCDLEDCRLYRRCGRVTLHPAKQTAGPKRLE